jgi:VCBS repeat-containing protein
MRTRIFTLRFAAAALTYASLALTGTSALSAEYWLKAGTTTVNLPGALAPVTMWGYALCGTGPTSPTGWPDSCAGAVSVPGPALTVPPSDVGLRVHLANGLGMPTSIVINGLIKQMVPVWDNGATGSRPNLTARVRSFDAEAAAPNGTADYTWPSVNPGTYLYQSGTQPQVQVQMGLYGAVTKNVTDAVAATTTGPAVPGQAYAGAGYAFDNEAMLLYSEIDPDLHAAVASNDFGEGKGTPSTINYTPRYFLINGAPYQFGASVFQPAGGPGITLLRLLNAGLTTHVPMIQGKHWDVIAEDGKAYTYRRTQYTALLPAAKTVDVLFTPEIGATYAIMDRRLSLSNNGLSDGGMLAFLRFSSLGGGGGDGNVAPVADDDAYASVRGVTLNVAAPGVLDGDTDADSAIIKAAAASGSTACTGTYSLNADGSFTYVPPAALPVVLPAGCTAASDTFGYRATDGKAVSNLATVTINLTVPVAPTLTARDDFTRTTDPAPSLGASWSQLTETVTSAPDIGISGGKAFANAAALGGVAIWNAVLGTTQGASGDLSANAYLVLKATGGTSIAAPANYIRVGCEGGKVVVSTSKSASPMIPASVPHLGIDHQVLEVAVRIKN